jgi:hypothetical protein
VRSKDEPLVVATISFFTDIVTVSWTAEVGSIYRVEYWDMVLLPFDELPAWTPLTEITADRPDMSLGDFMTEKRMYRVRLCPCDL